MPHPVIHWEITGRSFADAKKFYGEVFGWEMQDHEGQSYALVSAQGEGSIGGGIGETRDGQAPSLTFYIQVDDLGQCLDAVNKAGGKTVVPPTPIEGVGAMALFSDPDGNVVGLFKGGA